MATAFRPVRTTKDRLDIEKYNEGYIYMVKDSGQIFMDADGKRILLGNNGVSLFYGADEKPVEDPDLETGYILVLSKIENYENCHEGDLILNKNDGAFYQILTIDEPNDQIYCARLSISGGGGGSGDNPSGGRNMTFKVEGLTHSTVINGTEISTYVTATAKQDANGDYEDDVLTINWALYEGIKDEGTPYMRGTFEVNNGERTQFEFGKRLKANTTSSLWMTASGVNSGISIKRNIQVTTVDLILSRSSKFSPLTLYSSTVKPIMYCNVSGAITKQLLFYVDNELVSEQILDYNNNGEKSYTINTATLEHGTHTARFELYSYENNKQGAGPEPIEFEFAYNSGSNDLPIIWIGSYKNEYYNYDKIQIPFLAYDPKAPTNTIVNFYKDAKILESKQQVINFTSSSEYKIFEITDVTTDEENLYYISCGEGEREVRREIAFNVKTDPNRDMNIIAENLMLSFDATGRSNSESAANREKWQYNDYKATFENFNWYNNGWLLDENNNTCLRISNGAKFSIPIGPMTLNSNVSGIKKCTFEFQFKVKNISNYNKLIKEITRYSDDQVAYDAFLAQDKYDNYDAFLHDKALELLGKEYDDLVFNQVYKQISTANAFCKYITGTTGLCLGPQDAFFSDGTDTVNVAYVENQLINLSIVFSPDSNLILIYVNGVLTGVNKITVDSAVNITSSAIEFNSSNCDIDLYKVRVYSESLDLLNILKNYAVDFKDVLIYDQNSIASLDPSVGNEPRLRYEDMILYNQTHPDDYLMPYLIFDVTNTSLKNMPYKKAVKVNGATVTFVNTGLDRAYENGELLTKIKEDKEIAGILAEQGEIAAIEEYYKHHCPSFTTTAYEDLNNTGVTLQVQGTSSEFYPRRNYKIKTKGSDKNINMYMNAGPFESAYKNKEDKCHLDAFYYDNYTVGTTKFTVKIDYMESSGTYNMGMANFVANAYTKHPINDYNSVGAFTESKENYEVATSYDENTTYYELNDAGKYKKLADQTIVNAENVGNYYIAVTTYKPYDWPNIKDYRTSVQGFPVLGFRKNGETYTFLGRFNLLLDKGSDEAYGFKPNKKISQKFLGNKAVRKMAECWEFSDNGRTFCSFRDPLKRKEFSFSMTQDEMRRAGMNTEGLVFNGDERANSKGCGPIVTDSYEYRYHTDSDLLDYIYDITGGGVTTEDLADGGYAPEEYSTPENRNASLFKKMENWERACKWVWSTCVDYVGKEDDLINKYAVKQYGENATFVHTKRYSAAKIPTVEETILFNPTEVTMAYDDVKNNLTQAGLTEDILKSAEWGTVDGTDSNGNVIYTFSDSDVFRAYAKITGYVYVQDLDKVGTYQTGTVETYTNVFNIIKQTPEDYATDNIEVLNPAVTINSVTYYFDTQEYRLAKFKKELPEHFDLEYCLVYFLITEIFLCYDSRGKNCMMASWGPQKEGGDYIWYPIFYDIDTQLGINNTGIPSFEYYVNAQEEGCFSTNDSVLWANLYTCFKDDLKAKYFQMRGDGGGIININTKKATTPLLGSSTGDNDTRSALQRDVDHIEKWYLADPDECGSIAMRGIRPLMALNLDEYWKYISITNAAGDGYQNQDGDKAIDGDGTYFYALQGDRSLSRQQFLMNRINFYDSFQGWGEYARAGTSIQGRIIANDINQTSDKYIDNNTTTLPDGFVYSPYYVMENGTEKKDADGNPIKTNYLDADLAVKIIPYQRQYVTIGGDNSSMEPQLYKGDKAVYMQLPGNMPIGRRSGAKYGEQLFYIYGASFLQDIGDMSTLYWREFRALGASRLQRLLLGSEYPGYFLKTNPPSFDASKNSAKGKPMLKEVNLTGVFIENVQTLDFSSSEKLQSFRAVRSNIQNIVFAEGVALNTLHIPKTLTNLNLVEASQLKNLVTSYEAPTEENFSTWTPPAGLYIEDLTNNLDTATETGLNVLSINGDYFGYDSYKLLKALTRIKLQPNQGQLQISLRGVNWMPYEKLTEGYTYNASEEYYKDNGHYGLDAWTWDAAEWDSLLIDGKLFKKVINKYESIVDINMLKDYVEKYSSIFKGTATAMPEITGYIYIENSDIIDEGYIRNTLQSNNYYPNLNFFFKNVKPGYSGTFVQIDEDGKKNIIGIQKIAADDFESGTTVRFSNPYTTYTPKPKPNYDFLGWATDAAGENIITNEAWEEWSCTQGVMDYTFYAIYIKHKYKMSFYNDDDTLIDEIEVTYNEKLYPPTIVPHKDESALPLESTYKHIGYSTSKGGRKVDLGSMRSIKDYKFYAVYEIANVYDAPFDEKFFDFTFGTYHEQSGYYISVKPEYSLSGKVTLPTRYNNQPIIGILGAASQSDTSFINGFRNNNDITHIFWYKDPAGMNVIDFAMRCFEGMGSLQYIEIPGTIERFGAYCMASIRKNNVVNVPVLKLNRIDINPDRVCRFDAYAFSGSPVDNESFTITGHFDFIGNQAFAYQTKISTFNFGDAEKGCYITSMRSNQQYYQVLRQNPTDRTITTVNMYSDQENINKYSAPESDDYLPNLTGLTTGNVNVTYNYTVI